MPARSPSGAIRSNLGPLKSRLQSNTKKFKQHEDLDVTSIAESDVPAAISMLEVARAKLQSGIEQIESRDHEWKSLMVDLDGSDLEQENDYYDTAVQKPDGFFMVMENARELMTIIEAKFKLLCDRKTTLATAPAAVPAQVPDAGGPPAAPGGGFGGIVKLGRVSLPKLDGSLLSYQPFWSMFKTHVHEKPWSNMEKLTMLMPLLEKDAADAVKNIPMQDSSYDLVLKILQERFERSDDQIRTSLYAELRKIRPLNCRQIHAKALRKQYDDIEGILRQLEAVGEDLDGNHSIALDLMGKFPHSVISVLFERYGVTGQSKPGEFRKAVRSYIIQREDINVIHEELAPFSIDEPSSSSGREKRSSSPKGGPYQSSSHTATTFHASDHPKPGSSRKKFESPAPEQERKPKSPCLFCAGDHFASACVKYATVEDRKKRCEDLNRCARCFAHNHNTKNCKSDWRYLRCIFCHRFNSASAAHKTAFCPKKVGNAKPEKNFLSSSVKSQSSGTTLATINEDTLFSSAVTEIVNPQNGRSVKVRVVLDCLSSRNYITDNVASLLRYEESPTEQLAISTFGTKKQLLQSTREVEARLRTKDGDIAVQFNTSPLIAACSLVPKKMPPEIACHVTDIEDLADQFDPHEDLPQVLVGMRIFWRIIRGTPEELTTGLFKIPTVFGTILGGTYTVEAMRREDAQPMLMCLTESITENRITSALHAVASDAPVKPKNPDVDQFWLLESIGINDSPFEKDDEKVKKEFDETTVFHNGRYAVRWPWKLDLKPKLKPNFKLSMGRLQSLAKRLKQEGPEVCAEYQKVFDYQKEAAIIEEVPQHEIFNTKNTVHYLPHHPVIRRDHATTKLRIVFDASARCGPNSVSLNECLFRGPVILPDLPAILLRFRLKKIAIIADIEKAFLQLELQPCDRDVTRFLWFRDSSKLDAEDVITYRFARVPFGVISSPFMLSGTVQLHLQSVDTPVAKMMAENAYVDNIICGVSNEDEAQAFYQESKDIFKRASMNLREYGSNLQSLMDSIPAEDKSDKHVVKVLGLDWNTKTDTLKLHGSWEERKTCKTKRQVLASAASIFDPMGWFQPCTLLAKLFLRRLWDQQSDWDVEFDSSLQQEWTMLHEALLPIFDVDMDRYVKTDQHEVTDIVVFGDASKEAFGAVVYLRSQVTKKKLKTELVYSRSRLAPKSISKSDEVRMPRLELLGLTIATRAACFVRDSLKKPLKIHAFTDSKVVLGWLNSDKTQPVFVSNRVKQIIATTNCEIRHVSGEENPADLCSRGCGGMDLRHSKLWWNGPHFLSKNNTLWPAKVLEDTVVTDVRREATQKPSAVIHFLAGEGSVDNIEVMGMRISDYSSFRKLIKHTMTLLKFLKWAVWSKLGEQTEEKHPELNALFDTVEVQLGCNSAEWRNAKLLWIQNVQKNCFTDVFDALKGGKKSAIVNQLNVEMDGCGVLRSYGRLRYADLPEETINPILLPKKHPLTKLIIIDLHEKLFHAGINHCLNQLRKEFWVPAGRSAVKSVITRCLTCKKMKGPPFPLPLMPPWPRERVAKSNPFQFTGVDYLGPVNVQVVQVVDGEEVKATQKYWVSLFTCLATRAVHLEAVPNCTPFTFVNALSRFIARRGAPEEMISDNGAQFVLTKNLLDRTWRNTFSSVEVKSYIAERGIQWRTIVELAPWMGGVYERMVGLVKNSFKMAVGRRLLEVDEFQTLIVETEAIINSRPLTYVCSDIESGVSLRPIDFLTGLCAGSPEIDAKTPLPNGEAAKVLCRNFKYKQKRLDTLWQHLYSGYLTNLRERGQRQHRNPRSTASTVPSAGEVVIVKQDKAPRGTWKLAKITRLLCSNDGELRSAELLLPNGVTIKRSISHLYPLEVPPEHEDQQIGGKDADETMLEEFNESECDEAEEDLQLFQQRHGDDLHEDFTMCVISARKNLLRGLSNQLAAPRFC